MHTKAVKVCKTVTILLDLVVQFVRVPFWLKYATLNPPLPAPGGVVAVLGYQCTPATHMG